MVGSHIIIINAVLLWFAYLFVPQGPGSLLASAIFGHMILDGSLIDISGPYVALGKINQEKMNVWSMTLGLMSTFLSFFFFF